MIATLLLFALSAPAQAGPADRGTVESTPLTEATAGAAALRFEALAPERSGIELVNDFAWGHPLERLYPHGFAGGGVAVGDYDDDGLPDLYLTCQTGADCLYRNLGGLRFEEVGASLGIDNRAWSSGAAFADVDGDGDLDLLVCNYDAPNRLFINDGGSFSEQAAARGLDFRGASVMGAFADHDRDGDLDLYLVTNRMWPGAAEDVPRTRHVNGLVEVDPTQAEAFTLQVREVDGERQKYVVKAGQRDRLYINDGRGHFTDGSAAAGIAGNHPGLSATWWDADADGWPDLYVSNDFWDADRLYHNQGDGSFIDRAAAWAPNTPWFSMGADLGDLDGDGRVDFLAADMSATTHYMSKVMMGGMEDSRWFLESAEPRQMMRNTLLLATGAGPLREAGQLAGLGSSDWTWSVQIGDLDLDGELDTFFTNGTANHSFDPDFARRLQLLASEQTRQGVRDPQARAAAQWALYREQGVRRERNLAFAGRGDLRFEDVSRAFGLDHLGVSFGAALADLDRDGDLDLVVQNVGEASAVFENHSATATPGSQVGMLVELRGGRGHADGQGNADGPSNTRGLGARLVLESGGRTRVHQLFTTRGYMSAGEPVAHFAMGPDERGDLTVHWPSGVVQRVEGLAGGLRHVVREPEPDLGPRSESGEGGGPRAIAGAGSNASPHARVAWFETVPAGTLAEPVDEVPFDDYLRQPLLPGKLSREGPCLALGDVDGDGHDDLFVGGPAGTAGRLHRFEPSGVSGTFGPGVPLGLEERLCEDAAALFLDVDVDGDLDLFVASGGVEAGEGDVRYADRVYLNDGRGGFRNAPNRLEPGRASAGALAAADFDRDGDLDVFVGSRSIPGRYPLTPTSRLLLNQGGRLIDATEAMAPGLGRVGMVTGALFSDVDLDGWPDLLVTCEWGPVALFLNTRPRLREATAEAGLSGRTGWWNGLTAGDFDGDGDQDYAVANAGLNTKYKATPSKPARLYYGDFEGRGTSNLVEAKIAKESSTELLPVRGLSCSSDAMPSVGQKLPTFDAFASSTLEDIYGGKLEAAQVFEANELASGVLINASAPGKPSFTWRPLPRKAQLAPTQGMVAADFDTDGHIDLLTAENFYWREPETGRWNGGLGLFLRGDGTGQFRAVEPADSGWVVPGDSRALVLHPFGGVAGPAQVDTARAGSGARAALGARAASGARALVARNDAGLLTLRARAPLEAWRLEGLLGNPGAVGARVHASGGGWRQSFELAAGSGKLSQQGPVVFLPPGVAEVTVDWPDGTRAVYPRPADGLPRILRRGP